MTNTSINCNHFADLSGIGARDRFAINMIYRGELFTMEEWYDKLRTDFSIPLPLAQIEEESSKKSNLKRFLSYSLEELQRIAQKDFQEKWEEFPNKNSKAKLAKFLSELSED